MITAETRIAGVAGFPVRHSLSPVIHNAWLQAAGIDAVYVAFAPAAEGFGALVEGLRGGVCLGLNITLPFKEQALALANQASARAAAAGAANLLKFHADGTVEADNTDGVGLLIALEEAGYRPRLGPAVVLGAGGAARGAVRALLDAGAPKVSVVNRTLDRAEAIAALDPRVMALAMERAGEALDGCSALINATSLGMTGQPPLELQLEAAPTTCVVMDMVYRPLHTGLLAAARRRGHPTADGLAMLIGQAVPSFEAFFGRPPPAGVDVRSLCEAALGT